VFFWLSIQSGNKDDFFSPDFGLREFGALGEAARLANYCRFVCEKGRLSFESRGEVINASAVFRSRIRYFIDGGMIGTKAFMKRCYQMFRGHFNSKRDKEPVRIKSLDGVYSLKRLTSWIIFRWKPHVFMNSLSFHGMVT
jgi:putative transposase